MASMSIRQQELENQIDTDFKVSQWRDWRWQMRNTVRDLESFQRLTGIEFTDEEASDLKLTLAKFPLSVTPYYLSLIDTENWRNDPVCMQAFPSPSELQLSRCDMIDG